MAVTYGFYNALNHDRLYDAIQMSSIFDGIIRDGIFSTIGDTMIVTAPEDGMYVNVGSGRAWFNHTWTLNDAVYPIEAEQAEVVLDRIDAVILEVNSSTEVRANSIKFLKGTPSTNPVKPTLTHNAEVNQYALAYVRIKAGQTKILQSDIENAVGTDETPFITGVLQQVSIETLLKQWEKEYKNWLATKVSEYNSWFSQIQTDMNSNFDEFDTWVKNFKNVATTEYNNWLAAKVSEYTAWFAQMQTDMDSNFNEFETWFQRMKDQLSEDAAGHLQAQINDLAEAAKKGSIVTITTTDHTLFGKNVTISKDGFDPVTSNFNDIGVAYFETVPMVGDVTIEATNGISTAKGTLNIPYFGRYDTSLIFWEAILDISALNTNLYNRQIIVKRDDSTIGTSTFDSTGHAKFSVNSVGTYNVSAIDSLGRTCSADVEVIEETTYYVVLGEYDGATVEPTDDVTTWLNCANIENPTITTLSDVLGDRSLFETLLANSNACNYMTRSTTWSSSDAGIVNSQDAMSLIGKYSYCSKALLSNTTWAEAIYNSDYFEEVLNVSVPNMTSNTQPEGTVSASTYYSTSNAAYKAFDGRKITSSYTGWKPKNISGNEWIQYKFTKPVIISKLKISRGVANASTTFKVQASNDGFVNDSHDILSEETISQTKSGEIFYVSLNNTSTYQYYRVTLISSTVSYTSSYGFKIQFYGIENRTNVIHSAANDTIYMMENESKVVLTTTDSEGVGTLDFTQFDDGVTYTLYSTVAYLPGSSSTKFSKRITITKTKHGCTTEAYLMPDAAKTLYWYGYESDNTEDCKASNLWGISHSSSTSFNFPTHNTNYLELSSSSTSSEKTISGFGSKRKAKISKIHAVGKVSSKSSDGMRGLSLVTTKAIGVYSASDLDAVFLQKNTNYQYIYSDANGGLYLLAAICDGGGSALNLHALWYE